MPSNVSWTLPLAFRIRPHVDDRKHREAVRAVVDAAGLVATAASRDRSPVGDDVAIHVVAAGDVDVEELAEVDLARVERG
jgi:hypothetical protein